MDSSKIAAMLVSKANPRPDSDADEAEMAAQAIIDAFHAKDAKALHQALKDYGAYGGSNEDTRDGESGGAAAGKDNNRNYSQNVNKR